VEVAAPFVLVNVGKSVPHYLALVKRRVMLAVEKYAIAKRNVVEFKKFKFQV
jgi:hypothetical protein